jgi:hypothetical protein
VEHTRDSFRTITLNKWDFSKKSKNSIFGQFFPILATLYKVQITFWKKSLSMMWMAHLKITFSKFLKFLKKKLSKGLIIWSLSSRRLVVATTTKPNLGHLVLASEVPATSEAGARWPRFGLVVVATTGRRYNKDQMIRPLESSQFSCQSWKKKISPFKDIFTV